MGKLLLVLVAFAAGIGLWAVTLLYCARLFGDPSLGYGAAVIAVGCWVAGVAMLMLVRRLGEA